MEPEVITTTTTTAGDETGKDPRPIKRLNHKNSNHADLPVESAKMRRGPAKRLNGKARFAAFRHNSYKNKAVTTEANQQELEEKIPVEQRETWIPGHVVDFVMVVVAVGEWVLGFSLFQSLLGLDNRGLAIGERILLYVSAAFGGAIFAGIGYGWACAIGRYAGRLLSQVLGTTMDVTDEDGRGHRPPAMKASVIALSAFLIVGIGILVVVYYANFSREDALSTASHQVDAKLIATIGIIGPLVLGFFKAAYLSNEPAAMYGSTVRKHDRAERRARRWGSIASRYNGQLDAAREGMSASVFHEAGLATGTFRSADQIVARIEKAYATPVLLGDIKVKDEAADESEQPEPTDHAPKHPTRNTRTTQITFPRGHIHRNGSDRNAHDQGSPA